MTPIVKKFRKIGNSFGLAIPAAFFAESKINPQLNRFVFSIENNALKASILPYNQRDINERTFVRSSSSYAILIPLIAFELLNISPNDLIEISYKDNAILFAKVVVP